MPYSRHRSAFAAALGLLLIVCSFVACSTDDGVTPGDGETCANGKKDVDESDVDCGGACSAKCAVLAGCSSNDDCSSGFVCVKTVCAAATSTDGKISGSETDVDCGGPEAPPCTVGGTCAGGSDCVDDVCVGQKCAPPGPDDKVKNGDETDVDCGGSKAPPCDGAKACKVASDCASTVCTNDVCAGPSTTDKLQNGNETDIDCGGGPPASPCATGSKCLEGARDCDSKVCTGNVCQPPRGDDTVMNGDESGVDCGGSTTGAKRCAAGLGCNFHEDCASKGCAFDMKCAVGRSCTQQLGGVTCGEGEVGDPAASHESCCVRGALDKSAVTIDKYHVTAGRMRAFVDRVNGDVQTFAKSTTGWNAAWNGLVPSTVAEANVMLGSYWTGAPNDGAGAQSKRSCAPGSFGGHTYWTPKDGDDYSDFSKDELDVKALNCVGWHLARAFCSWEGGRLPTRAELINAYRNGGTTTRPWGSGAYNENAADNRLNHQFNYGYPNPAGRRLSKDGDALDIAWHVSPPGRFPLGRNANGVEIAGDLLHWASDSEYLMVYTGSWERHSGGLGTENWKTTWPNEPNGYYAIGLRCVYE